MRRYKPIGIKLRKLHWKPERVVRHSERISRVQYPRDPFRVTNYLARLYPKTLRHFQKVKYPRHRGIYLLVSITAGFFGRPTAAFKERHPHFGGQGDMRVRLNGFLDQINPG